MARVTVEDCIEQIPNRFDLVLTAAERARKLDRTDMQSPLEVENDKNTVVALREIAEGVSLEALGQVSLLGEEDSADVKAEEEGESSAAETEAEGAVAEDGQASEDDASAEENS